jgi:hypothetical protein
MVRHLVELDDSFADYFGDLDPVIQEQIRLVWDGLEKDPYFTPSSEEYLVQRRGKEYTVCQHISGWQGWSLVWFWEYFSLEQSTPEYVVFMLEHLSPPQRLPPRLPN